MRFIEALCPPAVLYLIFLVVQLGLDLSLGLWVTFTIKLILGLAVVKVLDTFCGIGLSPVSWFLVAAPFVVTALATAISIGTNFDQNVLIYLNNEEVKETFTSEITHQPRIAQPNAPEAGGPPEPSITPLTQSSGAMGHQWDRSASDENGTAFAEHSYIRIGV
jgi:hypothetical protein